MYTVALSVLSLLVAVVYGGKDKPVFSDEINEIIQSVHDECVGKTGVSEEDIANCEKGIFKEDTKLKCYMFCLLVESSLVDDDGTVDYDMLFSLMPEEHYERTKKMILACRHFDVPGQNGCQSAFDVHKCSYEKDPDLFVEFTFREPGESVLVQIRVPFTCTEGLCIAIATYRYEVPDLLKDGLQDKRGSLLAVHCHIYAILSKYFRLK